jgi:hypothetical protein
MVRMSWSTRNLGTDQLNLWTQQDTFIILIIHYDAFLIKYGSFNGRCHIEDSTA